MVPIPPNSQLETSELLESALPMSEFLAQYGAGLVEAISTTHPPKVAFGSSQSLDFSQLTRQPLGLQADAVAALVRSLEDTKGTLLVGEMGTGKTFLSIAAAHYWNSRPTWCCLPASGGLATPPKTPGFQTWWSSPKPGVIYAKPSASKIAEHGGLAEDDALVALLVSNPKLTAQTVSSRVETRQVAPSILSALGLKPEALQALLQEPTPTLPGLFTGP
ncbi:MAG: hypothetical protein IVW51_08500 [Thermaceae bacterium]|nr:hypothetical protein [Thermaceae bacterium]